MVAVAVATAIAVSMTIRRESVDRRLENVVYKARANELALSAIDWSSAILAQKIAEGESGTGKDGAEQIETVPVREKGVYATCEVADLQGKFNLNSMITKAGAQNTPAVLVFKRMLKLLELPEGLSGVVADWVDIDSSVGKGGAEDGYYGTQKPPYNPSNRQLVSLEELLLLKGFDKFVIERISPHVTALPYATGVNINNASWVTIAGLFDGLIIGEAKDLAARVENSPYTELEMLKESLPDYAVRDHKKSWELVAFSSNYFLLRVNVRYHHVLLAREAVVIIEAKDRPRVLSVRDI